MISQSVKIILPLVALLSVICSNYLANGQTCGKKVIKTQGLIVNGYATRPGDWPWHVAMFHIRNKKRDYACGASLVNEYQAISAAHCVVDQNGSPLRPDVVLLQMGAYDIEVNSANSIEQKADRIIIHEQYDNTLKANDVAIITMRSLIKFTPYIQPICIYNEDVENLARNSQVGNAVGWGITESDTTSAELKAATLPIIGFYECLNSNRPVFGETLTDNNFCAGYRNGTTVCNGDSGGGLFYNKQNTWYLIGIVSFASKRETGSFCSVDDYGVFVNVYKYRNWFEKYLISNPHRFDTNTLGTQRKAESKCLEYGTKNEAATYKERFYVTKVQLLRDTKHESNGHVISENYVISAANEIYGTTVNKVQKGKTKYNIIDIQFHPDYTDGVLDNNFALTKIAGKFEFAGKSKIACLYTQQVFNQNSLRPDFKVPKLTVQSQGNCQNKLKTTQHFLKVDADEQICTNVCLDGELFVRVPNSDFTRLLAIQSECEDDGDGPGIYGKIYPALDWIENVVWP